MHILHFLWWFLRGSYYDWTSDNGGSMNSLDFCRRALRKSIRNKKLKTEELISLVGALEKLESEPVLAEVQTLRTELIRLREELNLIKVKLQSTRVPTQEGFLAHR